MASLLDIIPPFLFTERLALERYNGGPTHLDLCLACCNTPTAHARMGDIGLRTHQDFIDYGGGCRIKDKRFKDGVADTALAYMIRLGRNDTHGEYIGMVWYRSPNGPLLVMLRCHRILAGE